MEFVNIAGNYLSLKNRTKLLSNLGIYDGGSLLFAGGSEALTIAWRFVAVKCRPSILYRSRFKVDSDRMQLLYMYYVLWWKKFESCLSTLFILSIKFTQPLPPLIFFPSQLLPLSVSFSHFGLYHLDLLKVVSHGLDIQMEIPWCSP